MQGSRVHLVLLDGSEFEGVCKTYTATRATLREARRITPGNSGSSPVIRELVVPAADVVSMSARSVEAVPTTKTSDSHGFKTDTAISGGSGFGQQRVLQKWTPSADDQGVALSLDDAPSGHWDQFAANESLFGVKTDFKEEIYTTVVDKSDPNFRKREAEAARLAAEIERPSAAQAQAQAQAQTPYTQSLPRPSLESRDPAAAKSKAVVATAAASRPQSTSGGIKFAEIMEKNATPANAVGATQQVEELAKSFRDFAGGERKHLLERKHQIMMMQKDGIISDFKQFSSSLKLPRPMPSDIKKMLHKDGDEAKDASPGSGSSPQPGAPTKGANKTDATKQPTRKQSQQNQQQAQQQAQQPRPQAQSAKEPKETKAAKHDGPTSDASGAGGEAEPAAAGAELAPATGTTTTGVSAGPTNITKAGFKFNVSASEFTPSSGTSAPPSQAPRQSPDSKGAYFQSKRGGKPGQFSGRSYGSKPYQPKGSPKPGSFGYDEGYQPGMEQYQQGYAMYPPQAYMRPPMGMRQHQYQPGVPPMAIPPGPGGPAFMGPMYPAPHVMPYPPEMMAAYPQSMMMPTSQMAWMPDGTPVMPDGTPMMPEMVTTPVEGEYLQSDPHQQRIRPAFHHKLPEPLATHAIETMRLSVRGNQPDARHLYLYNLYKHMLEARLAFLVQNFHMTAKEYNQTKLALRKIGFNTILVRNRIFEAASRGVYGKTELARIGKLAQGPTLLIFSDLSDAEAPNLIRDFAKTIKPNKKMLLVGGKIDSMLVTADTFASVLQLPTLAHLRAELVGLLEMPAQRIVGTLSQTPSALLATLQQHQNQIKGE
nr:hypothetical protein HK105_005751 [Polyrhizophydium stewartii]